MLGLVWMGWLQAPAPARDAAVPEPAALEPASPDAPAPEAAEPAPEAAEPAPEAVEPAPEAVEPAPEAVEPEPEPEPVAPPLHTFDPMDSPRSPAPATDDELPEYDRPEPEEPFLRRGSFVTMGVGLTHCAQDLCTPIPMGGLARLELGYRLGRVAFVGTVTGGGGTTDDPDTDEASIRMLDIAAGALLLPVREGRVDPFLGATLGYASTIRVFKPSMSSNDRQYTKRGALRLSGGILWHVGRRVSLGPRVDWQLPFAGEWCTRFDPEDAFPPGSTSDDQCVSIREDIIGVDEDEVPNEEKRRARRAFPRPWALTLDLRIAI